MGVRLGISRVSSKPCLRVLSTVFTIFFLLFTSKWLPFREGSDSVGFSASERLRSVYSRSSPLRFSTYRYEAPQDLFVYPGYGRSIEAESSVAKVTILFHGRDPTYIRAIQTHQAHNRRFGYPLLILRHGILDGIWSKPAYLLAILLEELRKPDGQRLKWLCWIDADTVITNPNIPLDIFLPPEEFPHLHLLATADPHGLNNGVFFLKIHPWSVELLSAVIAYPTFRPDQELQYRDQSALVEILKEKKFSRNFAILPQRWFNAYQTERDGSRTLPFQLLPGDLLVHFPGVPDRDARMGYYLDRAEHHYPSWELALESTSYLNETRDFWAAQHRILAKQRTKAQTLAVEAREELVTTQHQLETHAGIIDSGELERLEKHVKLLKDTLEDSRDDIEVVKDAYKKLQKSRRPLLEAIEAPKKELHQHARTVLLQSEQQLLQPQSLDSASDVDRHLRSQIDVLKRLLVEAPDDLNAIQKAVEEMQQALKHEEQDGAKPSEGPSN